MDGLICEQQVPRIRKEGSFKLSGRRTCSTLHWHRAWICLGEICWAQNIEALFMTQTSSIPWSGSTCFNPCHLILESFLIFTHGCEAIPNWVPPSEASFARTKHSPQKSDPRMIRRGWSTGLWLDLNGYDQRLILCGVSQAPSVQRGDQHKPLEMTYKHFFQVEYRSYLTVVRAFTALFHLHPYVATKRNDVQIYGMDPDITMFVDVCSTFWYTVLSQKQQWQSASTSRQSY